jgi:hypothetical protein
MMKKEEMKCKFKMRNIDLDSDLGAALDAVTATANQSFPHPPQLQFRD